MNRESLIGRKCLAIGIILLFMGASIAVADNSVQKKTIFKRDTPEIEHIPADGLYWNNRKIADYHVPLYLHYYFKFRAVFYPSFIISNATSEIYLVEYYLDGTLIGSITVPPWEFEFMFPITLTPFHHSPTYRIKIYLEDEQTISDNITIYRLFP